MANMLATLCFKFDKRIRKDAPDIWENVVFRDALDHVVVEIYRMGALFSSDGDMNMPTLTYRWDPPYILEEVIARCRLIKG